MFLGQTTEDPFPCTINDCKNDKHFTIMTIEAIIEFFFQTILFEINSFKIYEIYFHFRKFSSKVKWKISLYSSVYCISLMLSSTIQVHLPIFLNIKMYAQ